VRTVRVNHARPPRQQIVRKPVAVIIRVGQRRHVTRNVVRELGCLHFRVARGNDAVTLFVNWEALTPLTSDA
jgi:hypothetical protein